MSQLKQFSLPDVGEGLTEAEILRWHVSPGDKVKVNQIIVEIETAKAAVELPCPYAGVISQLHAQPGDTVNVGTPIVTIDLAASAAAPPARQAAAGSQAAAVPAQAAPPPQETSQGKIGEEMPGGRIATLVGYGPRSGTATRRPRKPPTLPPGAPTEPPAAPAAPAAPTAPAAGPPGNGLIPAETADFTAEPGHVPLAKPPVRKLAKELGVDLRTLTGSGPAGVITREDVNRAATAPIAEPAAVPAPTPFQPGYDPATREQRVPIRGVRKATATAMVTSAFTAPHVTEFLAVDVTPMIELRARLLDSPAFRGVKLSPLTFAAKAVCLAARRTPEVNATWDEDAGEIVFKQYVHLGIAAATPRGLLVPKIRDADRMSLRELAEAIGTLTQTARDGKTAPADMIEGTFTITNVGVFGIDTGTPIINPGESAILALGAIKDMPWVVDGQIVPRKICQLSLSFDHRIVDGQQGSQFLADVGAILADPAVAITY
jgi:2-oxoisovalerate dehydrogenase E2 component (dihydrolipoyl transacylase)